MGTCCSNSNQAAADDKETIQAKANPIHQPAGAASEQDGHATAAPSRSSDASFPAEDAAAKPRLVLEIPSRLAHLLDGMTIEGMRKVVKQMPSDIVERVNKANHMFPPNKVRHLHRSRPRRHSPPPPTAEPVPERLRVPVVHLQHLLKREWQRGSLRLPGAPEGGAGGRGGRQGQMLRCVLFVAAAAFAPRWAPPLTRPPHPPVSWYLEVEMETLFDACEEHLKENGLPEDTKFWCCFYSFRQNHITEDLPYLSACVAQVRKVNI